MKFPRINLIIRKKHLVTAGLGLVLVAGLITNFAISNNKSPEVATGENYGDTVLVSEKADELVSSAEITQQSDTDDYFAGARLDRKVSREEAAQLLQSLYNGGDVTKEEMAVMQQDAVAMSDMMEAETKIETLLKAQGFEDVICYLSNSGANIIVKTPGLDPVQAAQIKSALLSEIEYKGEDITIVEVN